MRVWIMETLAEVPRLKGTALVVDVFRFCTTVLHVAAGNPDRILATAGLDVARRIKAADPDRLLMGERDAKVPPDFDYGNSPALIEGMDFSGRTVVMTTSAGTQGLNAAIEAGADEVLTLSFANAGAVEKYIREKDPEDVSILAMGTSGREPSAEDMMCALYLKNALEEFPNSMPALRRFLRTIPSAQKFFDPEQASYAPERDFELCLELDRFDFVVKAEPAAEPEWEGALKLSATRQFA